MNPDPSRTLDSPAIVDATGTATKPPTRRQRMQVTALCMAASLSFYVLSAGPISGLARVLKLESFSNAV